MLGGLFGLWIDAHPGTGEDIINVVTAAGRHINCVGGSVTTGCVVLVQHRENGIVRLATPQHGASLTRNKELSKTAKARLEQRYDEIRGLSATISWPKRECSYPSGGRPFGVYIDSSDIDRRHCARACSAGPEAARQRRVCQAGSDQ